MFKGASIIPIIEHNKEICILLFGDCDYQIHMDLGGHADLGEHPCQTACRECREESLNTFDLDPSKIILNIKDDKFEKDISNYISYNNYYAFFLKFDLSFEVICRLYQTNKDIIFNKNAPNHWRETGNVSLFNIHSLLDGKIQGSKYFECNDIFGDKKIIHHRPIQYLKTAIDNKIFYKVDNSWKTKIPISNFEIVDNTFNHKKSFLDKTQSIVFF